MRTLAVNFLASLAADIGAGRASVFNCGVAVVGLTASFNLKEWAAIFASLATGLYFTTQTILALRKRARDRRFR